MSLDRIGGSAGSATGVEIGPTAKLTADLRRHSDIPLAGAVAELIDAASFARAMPGGDLPADVRRWMAPLVEARYKCLSDALEQARVSQVLEFASGFAFRSVAITARSPLLYVDTDLPGLHRQRQAIRAVLERREGISPSSRCLFVPLDILSASDIDAAAALLRPGQPVAILSEGIFPYLSAGEKQVAACNVARLLRRFGGLWLTPDFKSGNDGIERLWETESAQLVAQHLRRSTGQTRARDRSLRDVGKVHDFLARHGLVGEMRPAIPDPDMLSSARSLGTGEDEKRALQAALALWIIRRADGAQSADAGAR